jgi:alpha-galactosidase
MKEPGTDPVSLAAAPCNDCPLKTNPRSVATHPPDTIMSSHRLFPTTLIVAAALGSLAAAAPSRPADGKLKIFILSGQSNMVGFGQVKGSPGTMETYLKSNPKDYGHLVDENGAPVVRKDVWVVDISYPDKPRQGWLATGFGADPGHIGPEYGFGFQVGDYYEDPVLIIKSAWGGRSLSHNFLPPGAGNYPQPQKDGDAGFQYAEILRHVREITGNLGKYYPHDAGKGWELAGFGWHQGWNDRIDQKAVDAYEQNLVHLIKDLRKDLDRPKLPFVIANTGMGGWNIPDNAPYKKRVEKLMNAQLAVDDAAKYPDFKGNVAGVETRGFQRTREESPSKQDFHWLRNWETLYLIGKSMGDSMVGLLAGQPVAPAVR